MPFPSTDYSKMLDMAAYLFNSLAPIFLVICGISLGVAIARFMIRAILHRHDLAGFPKTTVHSVPIEQAFPDLPDKPKRGLPLADEEPLDIPEKPKRGLRLTADGELEEDIPVIEYQKSKRRDGGIVRYDEEE